MGKGSGHIVNISSLADKYYPYKTSADATAEWGVNGLTRITQVEGRRFGVKATLVHPGPVDTRVRRENPDDYADKLAHPEDVADVILVAVTKQKRDYTPILDLYPFEDPGGGVQVPEK